MSIQTAIRPCTMFTTTNLSTLYPDNSLVKCLTKTTTKEEFAQIAQTIKKAGFSLINDGDEHGTSVVMVAACVNHVIFRTISNEYNRNPELLTSMGRTNDGWTPLHVAAYCNQMETAYTLISLGSPMNLTTTNEFTTAFSPIPKGSTPLDIAYKCAIPSSMDMVYLLEINGGKHGLPVKDNRMYNVDNPISRMESLAMGTMKSVAQHFSQEYQRDFLNADVHSIVVGYLSDYNSIIDFS